MTNKADRCRAKEEMGQQAGDPTKQSQSPTIIKGNNAEKPWHNRFAFCHQYAATQTEKRSFKYAEASPNVVYSVQCWQCEVQISPSDPLTLKYHYHGHSIMLGSWYCKRTVRLVLFYGMSVTYKRHMHTVKYNTKKVSHLIMVYSLRNDLNQKEEMEKVKLWRRILQTRWRFFFLFSYVKKFLLVLTSLKPVTHPKRSDSISMITVNSPLKQACSNNGV